jgi:hypothetical protein
MGQSGVIHDFKERLAFSETASDEPFWEQIYRKAFPGMVNMMLCSGDTESQRQGIDRIILLASGKVIKIDEKKREKQYQDILLEYISVDTTGAPGWIEKDLPIDYLAYAFMPSKCVYLFPWDMLCRAWLKFKNEWKEKYETKRAQNKGYSTLSVAIPIDILQRAVSTATIIRLEV